VQQHSARAGALQAQCDALKAECKAQQQHIDKLER
jgi:hypothetical protein